MISKTVKSTNEINLTVTFHAFNVNLPTTYTFITKTTTLKPQYLNQIQYRL